MDKISPSSKIASLLEEGDADLFKLISCFSGATDANKANGDTLILPYEKEVKPVSKSESITENKTNTSPISSETEVEFYLNPSFLPDKKGMSKLKVQNSKSHCYYFKAGEQNPMFDLFRAELLQNKSEFRFLPEEEEILMKESFSKIYELERSTQSSIHRFSDLKQVSINRFQFSKFLGKISKINTLIQKKDNYTLENQLLTLFNPEIILEFYLYWERVFQIFIANHRLDLAERFAYAILESLNNHSDKTSEAENRLDPYVNIVTTLTMYFLAVTHRTFALVWSSSMKQLQKNIKEKLDKYQLNPIFRYHNLQESYCKTRMVNKYAMPILIETLNPEKFKFSKKSINLTKFEDMLCHISHEELETQYTYSPYHVTLAELEFMEYTKVLKLKTLKKDEVPLDFHKFSKISTEYAKMNFNYSPSEKNYYKPKAIKSLESLQEEIFFDTNKTESNHYLTTASTNGKRLKKIKIALANTMLKDRVVTSLLDGHANRSQERYSDLISIVNEAIKEKVDFLVMPELFVPYEWLPLLTRISAQHGIAIVTGVEYVVVPEFNEKFQKNYFNLTATILPYTRGKQYKQAHLNLRNKVCFSPEEKKTITGYHHRFTEGTCLDLFCWNDFWFSPYCCFELSSVSRRGAFYQYIDALIAVEWNRDIQYFSNIVESATRDLHCYCIQVNASQYGDSRITQPTSSWQRDIIRVKGGTNSSILVGEIDISALRDFQRKDYILQKEDDRFKPTPPEFSVDIVQQKISGTAKPVKPKEENEN